MKYTDAQIKKALKELEEWKIHAYHDDDGTDEDSHELYEALIVIFDLINCQEAEIERLNDVVKRIQHSRKEKKYDI